MQETNKLLTVAFCSNEKVDRESSLYRKLMAAKLKYDHEFEILPIVGKLDFDHVSQIIRSCESTYIIFIDEKHEISPNFVKILVEYLRTRTVYLAEPYMYFGNIPAKPESTALDNKYFFARDTDIYGVAFNTRRLTDFLDAIFDIDKSAIYLSYRLYWSLPKIKPLPLGYSVANNTKAVNGSALETSANRLLPALKTHSAELRTYILRFLTVYLRGLRTDEHTRIDPKHLMEIVHKFNLDSLTSLLGPMQQFEVAWIQWLGNPSEPEVLFKQLTESDAYLRFDITPTALPEDSLYSIRTANGYLTIRRVYRPHENRADYNNPAVYDFYSRPVTNKSTIIFYDRPLQADDNAEYLYEYFMTNHPDFEKCYFALHPKSTDWQRLEAKGFKLVPFFTKRFYELFLESDVVISSQIYNLSYKGKNLKNSRSIYLQHGIQLNDMSDWINSKHFDVFVATGRPEEEYIRAYAPIETLNSGLPRLESLERKSGNSRNVLFMPTWRFNLSTVTDQQFVDSDYYHAINELMTNERILRYLSTNEITMQVKLHPNIFNRTHLFNFSPNVVNCTFSYRDAISSAEFALTDFSSVVLDAAFINTPIAYYQWDASVFFQEQPYENRLNYETEGLGPVFYESEDIIDYIASGRYTTIPTQYLDRKTSFFEGVSKEKINETIFEKMLEL